MAFPIVPIAPGVPPLPRDPNAIIPIVQLLTHDTFVGADGVAAAIAGLGQPIWGVFLNGVEVLTPDTFLSLGYKQSWSISDYPIEQGGFESYDKVNSPFDVRIRIATGGSQGDRQFLLNQVEAIANTLQLYTVVTPEKIYPNMNVSHFDYHRRATDGVGILTIELWFTEIRQTQTATFSDTKSPTAAGAVSDGIVQSTEPTDDQKNAWITIVPKGGN